MTDGATSDDPKVANLKEPDTKPVKVMTSAGPMLVDMRKVKEVADQLGIDKHDVFSIPGYRNARGELVPMYDAIEFEYHKPPKKLPTDRPDPVHCCNGCPHPDHGGEFPS